MPPPRSLISGVLLTAGVVLALVGVPGLYVREELLEKQALENRLAAAIHQEDVREVAAEQIVSAAVDAGATELLSLRPVLIPAVEAFLGSPPFMKVVRLAANDMHAILVEGKEESVVLDLGQGTLLLLQALRSVSPDVASFIPEDINPAVLSIDKDEPVLATVRELGGLRKLGALVPILGMACLVLAVAVSPRRRIAIARAGAGVALAGGLLVVLLAVGRAFAVRDAGAEQLPDEQAGDAVGAFWDAMLGDLRTWGLFLVVAGAAIAFTAGGAVEPGAVARHGRNFLERFGRAPSAPGLRAARGVALALAGGALVLAPTTVVSILAAVAGIGLAWWGLSESVSAVEGRRAKKAGLDDAKDLTTARVGVLGVAAVLAVGASAVAAVLVAGERAPHREAEAEARPADGCLGSKELCGLRLNEVTFPSTHNSFSAADEAGWLFANQRHRIERQLKDGIRGFLLDIHLGVRDEGKVRTDLQGEQQNRNHVATAIGPEYLAVAERLAGRLGGADLDGPREIFMCHSACELGAEPALAELKVFKKFLDANPGEIVFLFVEPYVPPRQIEEVFIEAGLFDMLAELDRDEPLPTLGELVADGKRVVVMAEMDGGGLDWYHEGFSFTQDTPLGAKTASEFSCRRERGDEDSPLLMINHWVDSFPPPPKGNDKIGGTVMEKRVRQCMKERKLTANLIAVDFYDTSGVVELARELNGEAAARAKRLAKRDAPELKAPEDTAG